MQVQAPPSPFSPALPGANSAGPFPSTAVRGAGLVIAGHGVGGVSGFTLSCTGGEALLSISPQGHREQAGVAGLALHRREWVLPAAGGAVVWY